MKFVAKEKTVSFTIAVLNKNLQSQKEPILQELFRKEFEIFLQVDLYHKWLELKFFTK